MATMAMPNISFDAQVDEIVEDVEFIRRGINFANRMSLLWRLAYKAFALIYAFNLTLRKQRELIDALNGPAIQNLTEVQIVKLAERVENLVKLNNAVLALGTPRFDQFTEFFVELESQRDHLESFAESYRCAAEFDCENLIALTLETVCA